MKTEGCAWRVDFRSKEGEWWSKWFYGSDNITCLTDVAKEVDMWEKRGVTIIKMIVYTV